MNKSLLILVVAALVAFGAAVSWGQEIQPADTCDNIMPGDANSDGSVNVGDVIYLIKFFYDLEAAPNPLANGDYNGDCVIDSMDVYGGFQYIWKCVKDAKCGYPAPVTCTCQEPEIGEYYSDRCFGSKSGDANNDDVVSIGDAVYIINYVFRNGSEPEPYKNNAGDGNCDCSINVADAIAIIHYVFKSGPAPCDCDTWQGQCGQYLNMAIEWLFMN